VPNAAHPRPLAGLLSSSDDAAIGNHLWADRYDRTLEDVFLDQEEVRRSIATVPLRPK
jgi:TolB-like protein